MIVRVPAKYRVRSDMPDVDLELKAWWLMTEEKIGVFLGMPGERTGRRWPITRITKEQLESWQPAPPEVSP